MTIAEQLAGEAKKLTFRELPSEVVQQVKRSLFDTIGIGLGGYLSRLNRIIQDLIKELNGPSNQRCLAAACGLLSLCHFGKWRHGASSRLYGCRFPAEGADRARQ
jgi:hypothetical protein